MAFAYNSHVIWKEIIYIFFAFNMYFLSTFVNRLKKRSIVKPTINKTKEMIDINIGIPFNNNSNALTNTTNTLAAVHNKLPLEFDTNTTINENDYIKFFKSSTYRNAFRIETIVLLLMFTICTIIYTSEYY